MPLPPPLGSLARPASLVGVIQSQQRSSQGKLQARDLRGKAVCVSYHGRRRGDGEPGLAEEEEVAGVFCYPLLGRGRL